MAPRPGDCGHPLTELGVSGRASMGRIRKVISDDEALSASRRVETPGSPMAEWTQLRIESIQAAGAGKGPTGAFRTWRRWMRGLPNPIDDVDRRVGKRLAERKRAHKPK